MKNARLAKRAIPAALCALALVLSSCGRDERPEPPRDGRIPKLEGHRAIAGTFPRDRMMRMGHRGRGPEMAALFHPEILDGLGLTDAQKKALKENAVESRRKRAEINKQIELARIDLEQALEAWPVDPGKIRAAGAKLAEERGRLAGLRVEMTAFLLSSLDSAQHARLGELRREPPRPQERKPGAPGAPGPRP